MEHEFTKKIREILSKNYGKCAEDVYGASQLLQYLNIKTRSANKGSKARGSFANLYAIYVLVEDFLAKGYDKKGKYSDYEGAIFSDLFRRQRQLPFGQKLQNHALNHRMNEEYRKYFPAAEIIPILRDHKTNRYWFNENLISVSVEGKKFSLAASVIEIIDAYVQAKRDAFELFIKFCEEAQKLNEGEIIEFITKLIQPTVDARIFEIVSYGILRSYYFEKTIFWGFEKCKIQEDKLKLYKTGRTNANDGGIDFVMKPLGRFFQVTEIVDVDKYFLDMDKIEKYHITFVFISSDTVVTLKSKLAEQAEKLYSVKAIVKRYMESIEEIINVPILLDRFKEAISLGKLKDIMTEIIQQSKVEFNYEEEEDAATTAETLTEEES